MRLPISGSIAEIFSQYFEHLVIKHKINNLQFSLTHETDANNTLEHLLIHRTTQGFETEIYRKPTSIVPVIHFTSNQPTAYKTAAC
jgi:hypothetical protein